MYIDSDIYSLYKHLQVRYFGVKELLYIFFVDRLEKGSDLDHHGLLVCQLAKVVESGALLERHVDRGEVKHLDLSKHTLDGEGRIAGGGRKHMRHIEIV